MKTIDSLKKYVDKNANTKLKGPQLYKVYSSFGMLEAVDLMLDRYFVETQEEKGAIFLDVFGLLQGFFVAVDALYDLSIALTKFKYTVNLNQNPILHELKFIRNDIVGHPTNRTYPDGSIGFSIFNEETLSKDLLTYNTYNYKNQILSIKENTVDFKRLSKEYKNERDIILKDLEYFCLNDQKDETYTKELFDLYQKLDKGFQILRQDVENIKTSYLNIHSHTDESKNRFFWRIDLLFVLLDWKEEDIDLSEMVNYMQKMQILKLYKIGLELEGKSMMLPYVKIPSILRQFFKFIKANEQFAYRYLKNLNNKDFPYYENEVNALFSFNPPRKVAKLLEWLVEENDSNKVFLIGSTLNSYNKKII